MPRSLDSGPGGLPEVSHRVVSDETLVLILKEYANRELGESLIPVLFSDRNFLLVGTASEYALLFYFVKSIFRCLYGDSFPVISGFRLFLRVKLFECSKDAVLLSEFERDIIVFKILVSKFPELLRDALFIVHSYRMKVRPDFSVQPHGLEEDLCKSSPYLDSHDRLSLKLRLSHGGKIPKNFHKACNMHSLHVSSSEAYGISIDSTEVTRPTPLSISLASHRSPYDVTGKQESNQMFAICEETEVGQVDQQKQSNVQNANVDYNHSNDELQRTNDQ